MKKALLAAAGMFLLLQGCVELEEKIVIRNDGSGYYAQRTQYSKELTSIIQKGMKGFESNMPVSREDLKKQFSARGLKIVRSRFELVDGRLLTDFQVEFRDPHVFFNIPSVRNRFRLFRERDRLMLEMVSQQMEQEPSMRMRMKSTPPPEMNKAAEKLSEGFEKMGKDLQKAMSGLLEGLKFSLTVELPNEILDSNAHRIEGRIAHWSFDQETIKKMGFRKGSLDRIWASCSIKGLAFRPPDKKKVYASTGRQPISLEKRPSFPGIRPRQPEPSGKGGVYSVPSVRERAEAPSRISADSARSGGPSVIFLKNGSSFEVEGYYREKDMLTFQRYGGTFSVPVSRVEAIQPL